MGYIFALLSGLMYGASDFFIHMGSSGGKANTTQALFVNLVAGNVLLWGAVGISWFAFGLPSFHPAGVLFFIAAGISTPLFARYFIFAAIQRIGASRTASLKVSEALFTMLLAMVLLGNHLSVLSFAGASLLMTGIIVIIQESSQFRHEPIKGIRESATARETAIPFPISPTGMASWADLASMGSLFALAAGLAAAFGGIFRQMAVQFTPSALWGSAIGTLVALLVTIFSAHRGGHLRNWPLTSRETWFYSLGGIASSAGMLSFFYALLAGSSVSVTAALKNISPLFTLLLSLVALGAAEGINRRLVGSILLVVVGAWLIVYF